MIPRRSNFIFAVKLLPLTTTANSVDGEPAEEKQSSSEYSHNINGITTAHFAPGKKIARGIIKVLTFQIGVFVPSIISPVLSEVLFYANRYLGWRLVRHTVAGLRSGDCGWQIYNDSFRLLAICNLGPNLTRQGFLEVRLNMELPFDLFQRNTGFANRQFDYEAIGVFFPFPIDVVLPSCFGFCHELRLLRIDGR